METGFCQEHSYFKDGLDNILQIILYPQVTMYKMHLQKC
jgi:hypothetical protein